MVSLSNHEGRDRRYPAFYSAAACFGSTAAA